MSERDALIEAMARAVRAVGPNGFPDEYATAALAALEAAGVRLVPSEATGEMADVGTEARWQSAVRDANNQNLRYLVREIYRAMIAASPYAPRG